MFAPTICAANAELLRQPSTQESVRKAALQVQEKADKGVCKPQADSEVRANSAGRVEQVFPRIVFSGMGKDYRANHVRPYGDNLVPLEKGDVPKGQGDYPSGTTCHLPFQGRQKTPPPFGHLVLSGPFCHLR